MYWVDLLCNVAEQCLGDGSLVPLRGGSVPWIFELRGLHGGEHAPTGGEGAATRHGFLAVPSCPASPERQVPPVQALWRQDHGEDYQHQRHQRTTTEELTTARTTEEPTTTTASTTTSISSTSLVCSGNIRNGQTQVLFQDGPPQNPVTVRDFFAPFAPANLNCLCVGGTGNDQFVPGYLSVALSVDSNPFDIRFISISSPNGTEITSQAALFRGQLWAGTVAFNGFSAVGDWTIKVLDGNRNLATQKVTDAFLQFGLQDCNRISPASDCFGNFLPDGKIGIFSNRSLVGINLSSTATVQFYADLPPSCCLTFDPALLAFQFSNSPESNGLMSADGRSPEPGNAEFNLTGNIVQDFIFLGQAIPEIAGNPAAGLWNFNISTSGFDVVFGNNGLFGPYDPSLILFVESCP